MSRMSIIKELGEWLWKSRKWWLWPILITFGVVGIMIAVSQSSTVAPFIYTLF